LEGPLETSGKKKLTVVRELPWKNNCIIKDRCGNGGGVIRRRSLRQRPKKEPGVLRGGREEVSAEKTDGVDGKKERFGGKNAIRQLEKQAGFGARVTSPNRQRF